MAEIISIFSPKGGVGKTFIAVNLAAAFAQKLKDKKVLLLDMDLEFPGDAATILDLDPQKDITELFPDWEKGRYSPDQLNEYIIHYKNINFDFVPFNLKRGSRLYNRVDDKFLSCIVNDLGQQYDYIIADNGRSYSKLLLAFLGASNLILLVVNPDILSVYKSKEAISILQSFYIPINMIKVVLNRADSLGGVGWQEVMVALASELIIRIPSEGRIVGSALNRRTPLILDNKYCRVSSAFNKLVEALIAHPEFFIRTQSLSAFKSSFETTDEKQFFSPDLNSLKPSFSTEQVEAVKVNKEEEFDKLKQRIHKQIIGELELKRYKVESDLSKDKELRQKTMSAITNALQEETGIMISSAEERQQIIKEIADEVLGLGPLEDLLDNPEVNEILVNNEKQIYVERHGKLELTSKRFSSPEQVRKVIERIISPLGRRIDESTPLVDARLPDGSRVNAIIPPLSLTGPTLTIRKFARERLTVSDLTEVNTLNDTLGQFIKACVLARLNVIVSGGAGSGKTTILNVLSEFIPDGERIITIEDAAELKLHHQHWVRLETRAPNIEGKGAVTMRELFSNSLRMRPDRIIIGECRSIETLDMLQSMNTGHDGSMTTIHANSTQDVISRIDSLILMSGVEIPLRAIHEMIASAVNIIVHTARLSDGSRKILQVAEITGFTDDMHIGLKDIFVFQQTDIDEHGKVIGEFMPTGVIPSFYNELKAKGIILPETMFSKNKENF